MDEKPDQIINHIEQQRDQLGRNLNELENRVRRSTDWRTYYERNPMLVLGAALGGGVLLGATVGRSTDRSTGRYYKTSFPKTSGKSSSAGYTGRSSHIGGSYGSVSSAGPGSQSQTPSSGWTPTSSSGTSSQQSFAGLSGKMSSWADSRHVKQITETLEQVKGALIAFGVAKAKEFLGQAVPGLEQYLQNAIHGHTPSSPGYGNQAAQQQNRQRQNVQQGSENRPQSAGSWNTGTPASEQTQQNSPAAGSSDYRSGSRGFASSEPTPASEQYAGAGSARNPNVTP